MSKFSETLQFLGNKYSSKLFDLEECIYRKISDYEFEISGLHSSVYNVTLYVWKNKELLKCIDSIYSKEELLKRLDTEIAAIQHNRN